MVMPGPETSGTEVQIKFPHPVKAVTVFILQQMPAIVEIFKPVHEGCVIIRAEIMPVFKHK
jgi:hypothetical protein